MVFHFANKDLYSQSYGFSCSHVRIWELDHKKGWVPKNWAFELWCWRRLLRVPWTARKSIQSILKEINPEYSLERLMLKLKLQYFGHLMQRANSLEKTDAGKDWTQKKRAAEDEVVRQHDWFNGHELRQTPGDSEGQGSLACCSPWGCSVEHNSATELQHASFPFHSINGVCHIYQFVYLLFFSH